MTATDSQFLAEAQRLLDAGKYSETLEHAERSLVAGIAGDLPVQVIAAVAYRHGRLAQAISLLEPIANGGACTSELADTVAVLNCLVGRLTEALYWGKMAAAMPSGPAIRALFGNLPRFEDAFSGIVERPLIRRTKDAMRRHDMAAAEADIEQHLQLFANDVEALDLYSEILVRTGRVQEAIGVLRSVLTVGGHSATLLARLGRCLAETGDHESAIACHELAVTRGAKSAAIQAGLVEAVEMATDAASPLRDAATARYEDFLRTRLPKTVRAAPAASVKDRPVVGFLCSGMHDENMRIMLGRAAAACSRDRMTPIGFGSGELSDGVNIHYRGAFERWRDIAPLDELTLSALIRGEGVDVLIDFDGIHGTGHPSLFLRNAAPVMVSWLNGPCARPMPGATHALTGGSMASGPLLFPNFTGSAGHSPASLAGGAITLGADVTLGELNARTAMAWSMVLQAVPHATLLLRDTGGLTDQDGIDRLITLFGNFGVSHRIDVVQGEPAEFFAMVDVALAPLPNLRPLAYGAAIGAGLPVVVLDGGRAGWLAESLRAMGLGEANVAGSLDEYVAKAVAWCQDPARLAAERGAASAKALASAAFSPEAFAAALDETLRRFLAEKAGL